MVTATVQPIAAIAHPMEPPFNERGVTITRGGLTAGGQIFPLRDIHDTRVVTVQKNKVVPLAISLTGLAGAITGGALGSSAGLVVGVMLVVVGGLAWTTQDIVHRLFVITDTGEREVLTSPDREFVERVDHALRAAGASARTVQSV